MILRKHGLSAMVVSLALTASAHAAQVGPSVEVAPKAEGTRSQLLASVAWCEGPKCWLVAWREGYLNEDSSDIWCARVSADGKALDPAGVRLTEGPGLKSRPAVASDGKGFLVVWEDMRNSKDWDVYGAQVSADGKPTGKNGFLVAGGEHNQMRPCVTFSKGNYFVAWMGFEKNYGIYGVRVSGEGKLLDSDPLALALPASGNVQNITPALGANGEAMMLALTPVRMAYSTSYLAAKALDASSGKPIGSPQQAGVDWNKMGSGPCSVGGEGTRSPVMALGKSEATIAINASEPGSGRSPVVRVYRTDMTGAIADKGCSVSKNSGDRQGLAFDGANYLLVSDGVDKTSKVKGWVITPDGKPGAEFLVSEGSNKNCLSPAAAAGPAGATLVVYSEVRGADDTKVIARIVK